MKNKLFWAFLFFAMISSPALGETVHLKSGEIIMGRIVRVSTEDISVESDKGFGVIKIKRTEITLVEFDPEERDPSDKIGMGYYHRFSMNNALADYYYIPLDGFTLKFWLGNDYSIDFILGFFSNTTEMVKTYEALTLDFRYAQVFKRKFNLDLYWGASMGYIKVVDNTAAVPIDNKGQSYQIFTGAEYFPTSLRSLGISAEIGMGRQNVAGRKTTTIFNTAYPGFSMRYYF